MLAKLRIVVQAIILGVLTLSSESVLAEYYLEFPEPPIEFVSVNKHGVSKKHHHAANKHHKRKVSRGSVNIEVYYYWPVCPGCVCGVSGYACYPNDEQQNTRAVTGAYVHFHGEPYSPYKFKEPVPDYSSYDMRTIDDNVMYDPNMNNQYNEF